jgi:hypothetical protein
MSVSGKDGMSPDSDLDLQSFDLSGPVVELPARSREYHEPRPPPTPTQHQTLEGRAVCIGGQQSLPGRLGARVDRDAPTIQLRAVAQSGWRPSPLVWLVTAMAIAGGGAAGWLGSIMGSKAELAGAGAHASGSGRLASVAPAQARAAAPPPSVARTAVAPTSPPAPPLMAEAAHVAPRPRRATAGAAPAAASATLPSSTLAPGTSSTPLPAAAAPGGPAPHQGSTPSPEAAPVPPAAPAHPYTRPRSWLSDEAPKSWVR